jgi:hypothetical protein
MHQDDVDQDILPGADAEKVRLTAVALLHTKLIIALLHTIRYRII